MTRTPISADGVDELAGKLRDLSNEILEVTLQMRRSGMDEIDPHVGSIEHYIELLEKHVSGIHPVFRECLKKKRKEEKKSKPLKKPKRKTK